MATIKIADLLNMPSEAGPQTCTSAVPVRDKSADMASSEQVDTAVGLQKLKTLESPRALDDFVLSPRNTRHLSSCRPVATARQNDASNEDPNSERTASDQVFSKPSDSCATGKGTKGDLEVGEEAKILLRSTECSLDATSPHLTGNLQNSPSTSGNVCELNVCQGTNIKTRGADSEPTETFMPVPISNGLQNPSSTFKSTFDSKLITWTQTKWSTETLAMKQSSFHYSAKHRSLPKCYNSGMMKQSSSIRQRRAKRRFAVAVTKLEKDSSLNNASDDLKGNPERNLEKRMKNRAAVNKCRLKQKERLDLLEAEQNDIIEENRLLRESLQKFERTAIIEHLEALAKDKEGKIKELSSPRRTP